MYDQDYIYMYIKFKHKHIKLLLKKEQSGVHSDDILSVVIVLYIPCARLRHMQVRSRRKKKAWNFIVVFWSTAQKQINLKTGKNWTPPHPPTFMELAVDVNIVSQTLTQVCCKLCPNPLSQSQ